MIDPASAQFRDEHTYVAEHGTVTCGEINGKNSFGGYVGFKRFMASTTTSYVKIESESNRDTFETLRGLRCKGAAA